MGEFRAEALTTVINRDQDDADTMIPVWDISGSIKLKKGSTTIGEPSSPEQLRTRLHLLGVGISMLGMRHTNRAYLQGMTPQVINKYLAYLLGDHVYNLTGRSADGYTIGAPTWAQILVYELEIRRKAWDQIARGSVNTFAEELENAYKDVVVKERYFTTPTALSSVQSGRTRVQPDGEDTAAKDTKKKKKGGNGKGGNKVVQTAKNQKGGKGGKQKGATGGATGCPARSPSGIRMCYGYNDPDVKCTNKRCPFLTGHICGLCFQKRPMYGCPGRTTGAGETRGALLDEAFVPVQ